MATDWVEIYKDTAGEWRWRRQSANGEVVAVSGEGYQNRIDCRDEAERVNTEVEVREQRGEER